MSWEHFIWFAIAALICWSLGAFAGPDCHCRLFVYGARSGDYSAGSETVLYEERVEHQHERTGKEVPFED